MIYIKGSIESICLECKQMLLPDGKSDTPAHDVIMEWGLILGNSMLIFIVVELEEYIWRRLGHHPLGLVD